MKQDKYFSKQSGLALILAIIVTLTAQDVYGQNIQPQTLPELSQVLAEMDQAATRLSNFQVRSVLVRITSPGFWGSPDEKSTPALLINGKEVKIVRDLGVNDKGKVYLDQLESRITPVGDVQRHMTYWLDSQKDIHYSLARRLDYYTEDGKISQLNGGVPTADESKNQEIPFAALGYLQINHNPNSPQTYALRFYNARVIRREIYRGLNCIRLEWDHSSAGTYNVRGFALVCPERDYKEVYREKQAVSSNPKEPVKRFTQKWTVNGFKKYGEAWLPSDVSYDRQDFYARGETRSLKERFRLIDFQIEPDTSIFSPLFSPETRVFRDGSSSGKAELEIAGGDISSLRSQLQMGEFSVLNAEARDLNQP